MVVHARMDSPLEFRRDVLELALISTDAISAANNLKELAAEKKRVKKELKTLLTNLKKTLKIFERQLPPAPQDMRLYKKGTQELMEEELMSTMGGPVKPIEEVRREIQALNAKPTRRTQKEAKSIAERERLRREVTYLRKRIARLNNTVKNS